MDTISGDEGDASAPVQMPARPRQRMRRNCALLGASAIFVFVVVDSPNALFRKVPCDQVMMEMFQDVVTTGPKLLGMASGRFELQKLPFQAPHEDVSTLLKQLPKLSGRELKGYCAWRYASAAWVQDDWPAIPANGAAPPHVADPNDVGHPFMENTFSFFIDFPFFDRIR